MAQKYDDSNDDYPQERSTCKYETDDNDESFDEPLKKLVTSFSRSSTPITFAVQFFGKAQDCQTSGNQTIKDMLIENIPSVKLQKINTDNLIFKRISKDKCTINLGLPTGSLDNNDKYKCSCTETKRKKQYGNLRMFNVQNFVKEWEIGFFYIKIDKGVHNQPDVGDIKDVEGNIQIAFFPEETLYEAIVRDKRIRTSKEDEMVVKKWYLMLGDLEVPLRNSANNERYKNQVFKLHYHGNPTNSLPNDVQDLPEPSCQTGTEKASKKGNEVVVKQELNESLLETSDKKSSTPDSNPMPTQLMFNCAKDFEDFLENFFGIEKQATTKNKKKRSSNIKKLFSHNYNNLALKKGHVWSVSKLEEVLSISASVGAVVVELVSGEEFVGTCFVIGCEYVITNHHVMHSFLGALCFKDFFVDFDYKNGCRGHKFRFDRTPLVSSPELDYAILKLRDPGKKLPPSLAKCGYNIPSIDQYIPGTEWLTLVGFPVSAEKKLIEKLVEDLCPLKPLENLDLNNMVLSLSRHDGKLLCDTRNQTYNTSAFFHGSSGSPGVLMKKKSLVLLHCRGFSFQDDDNSFIEQGVRISAIRDDVEIRIRSLNIETTTEKLFDIGWEEEAMEIDSNNDL